MSSACATSIARRGGVTTTEWPTDEIATSLGAPRPSLDGGAVNARTDSEGSSASGRRSAGASDGGNAGAAAASGSRPGSIAVHVPEGMRR